MKSEGEKEKGSVRGELDMGEEECEMEIRYEMVGNGNVEVKMELIGGKKGVGEMGGVGMGMIVKGE